MTKLLYCTFVPSSLRITSSPRSPRGTTIRKLYLYAALNGLTGSDQADRGLTSGAGAAAAKSEPGFHAHCCRAGGVRLHRLLGQGDQRHGTCVVLPDDQAGR